MRKEPMTTEAKKAKHAAYMRQWLDGLSPERREALNAKRRGKTVPVAALPPDRLQKKRESAREYMRRKLASMTPEEKAAYLAKRREKEVPRQRERRSASPEIIEKNRKQAVSYYWRNREAAVNKQRAYRERCKQAVFDHYGRFCVCCGEDELVFLTLDHINGDGAAHRQSISGRSGFSMYTWLAGNGFPPGFQVLCYNCNAAKRTNHACPHASIVKTRLTSNVTASLRRTF